MGAPTRRNVGYDRLLTPAQIEQVRAITDTFFLDWDAVIVPLVGNDRGMEMIMPDGKLLVRPPPGAAFEPWLAGLRERLAGLDLSRAPRVRYY